MPLRVRHDCAVSLAALTADDTDTAVRVLLDACHRVDLDAMQASLDKGVAVNATSPSSAGRSAVHVICGAVACYTMAGASVTNVDGAGLCALGEETTLDGDGSGLDDGPGSMDRRDGLMLLLESVWKASPDKPVSAQGSDDDVVFSAVGADAAFDNSGSGSDKDRVAHSSGGGSSLPAPLLPGRTLREFTMLTSNVAANAAAAGGSTRHHGAAPDEEAGIGALLNECTVSESGVDGGETALMFAARCGFVTVVQLLQCFGVDYNVKDSREGMTALMFAGKGQLCWCHLTGPVRSRFP